MLDIDRVRQPPTIKIIANEKSMVTDIFDFFMSSSFIAVNLSSSFVFLRELESCVSSLPRQNNAEGEHR